MRNSLVMSNLTLTLRSRSHRPQWTLIAYSTIILIGHVRYMKCITNKFEIIYEEFIVDTKFEFDIEVKVTMDFNS